jgi:hypothetical protein
MFAVSLSARSDLPYSFNVLDIKTPKKHKLSIHPAATRHYQYTEVFTASERNGRYHLWRQINLL